MIETNKRITENIKKAGDQRITELNNELEILQSIGASEEQLSAKTQERLNIANEAAKANQEDIDNLEENRAKVEQLEGQIKNLMMQ